MTSSNVKISREKMKPIYELLKQIKKHKTTRYQRIQIKDNIILCISRKKWKFVDDQNYMFPSISAIKAADKIGFDTILFALEEIILERI
jgi:hypothetical protein